MNRESWKPLLAAFQKPSAARASWQLVNSVGAYLALWCAIALTIHISLWLTIPLVAVAGALLVRVFVICHDCGHGSFFESRAANECWGFVTGVLAFTPFAQWRGKHAIHHGSTGNLDRRGVGDIWTMTVSEYRRSSWWKRIAYRFARNPIVLLGLAPFAVFLVQHRIPSSRDNARERRSVWWTNLSLVALGTGMSAIFGILPYLILQLAILAVAGSIGVWLFYVQHQFEDAYWQRGDDWSYTEAALLGSTFLKLPRILQWVTGNIGYHHIHHLNCRIPNYNLQACHESHSLFEQATSMTVFRSIRAFSLKLWDETSGKLVRFRQIRLVGR